MAFNRHAKNMVGNVYGPGISHVGSYQVSCRPYITGSSGLAAGQEAQHKFPAVSRSITVINHANTALRVHFNNTGSGRVVDGLHYIELDSDEDSITMNVRAKEIWISSADDGGSNRVYRVVAELTTIRTEEMYAMTGSGLTD